MRPILYILLFVSTLAAEQLRISSSQDWNAWSLPGDAVSIEGGQLQPGFVRRDINAVEDALLFDGGIRDVGSNPQQAANFIDGDLSTYWSPDTTRGIDQWWIEVDLGRAVSANRIELHFADDGTPLEFFKILTSDGEPFFNNANSVIPGTLRYNKSTSYSFNQERIITIEFEKKPLQYIRIETDRSQANLDIRLSELRVNSIGDNISLGVWERGGGVKIVSEVGSTFGRELVESIGISNTLVDGDITTYWGTAHRGGSGAQPEQQFGQFELDLGALYWIDKVRMLGDGSGIAPGRGAGYHRGGTFNYLWYQFYVSDGSRSVDGSLRWDLMGELPSDPRNLQGIVHFEENFPLRKVRHVRLFFPMSDGVQAFNGRIGTTAEFQVFGLGHPAEAVATSPIYDLGSIQHITALHWDAEEPPGAHLEIRSRTGNELQEQYVFNDKNGKAVTQTRYDKLIPSFRGTVDTLRTTGPGWSTWSRPYNTTGEIFLSPAPRRFVQLELRFVSDDPQASALLDEINIEYNQPLAQSTRAEIFPFQALPGETSDFTYYLHSDFSPTSRGFDQIQLSSSAGLLFKALRINGETVEAQAEAIDSGVHLTLASPVRNSAQVEIDIQSTLYLNQTRFDGFLFNSELGQQVRQPVDQGDADDRIDSDVVFVALPSDDRLFNHIALSSPIFTPNDDGVHDQLQIFFDLLKVLEPRPVELTVFDLAGRRIATVSNERIAAGRIELVWDGRDETGSLVPPGMYLINLRVFGDAFERAENRLVSVAY
ncbi:MAG: hypothetical protein ACI8PG_003678 [Planctomycetota bacterium]|jgi:hypothetical protein